MEYRAEQRTCQNCKKDFSIEPEDFSFYEKIQVPPPTFCPECRLIRRMTWRNERSLFKRTCNKSGKEIITMFHHDAAVVVYDHDVWWGDGWDSTDYGMDYDFTRPFFEQYAELLQKVPLVNLANNNCVGSPYGNHNAECKFCYLLYASYNSERVHYSYGSANSTDCLDAYTLMNSELSFNVTMCAGIYKTHFSYDSEESINSFFLRHCKNLQDCIGCVNLLNKTHSIFNEQFSLEEYNIQKQQLDLGSYKNLCALEDKFNKFALKFPNKYANNLKCVNVSGDNITNAKNVKESFDMYGDVEDSKYLIHMLGVKDCYDIYGGGAGISLSYEGLDVGIQSFKQLFSAFCHTCVETFYTYMCFNSKNLFGCVGMRSKQYCILNKQYTKEEYEKLLPEIIKNMSEVPYVDKKGRVYKFGEFFPSEVSPFAYNEAVSQEYFPLDRNQILHEGYKYRMRPEQKYNITIQSYDLPDHIKDVPNSIINEIIACPNKGEELTQCTAAYRIIESELQFLKNNNLPLPRYCPNCRHYQRLKKRNPYRLWHRNCMCENETHGHTGKCEVEFETSYAPDRPEIIYCEKCYQKEVY